MRMPQTAFLNSFYKRKTIKHLVVKRCAIRFAKLKELEHRKLGGKVLILKYDLGKSLSKEMWCKMADTKKILTTYFKSWKLHVIYEVNILQSAR